MKPAEQKAKSIKAKPMFYAICLPALQKIAKKGGYNLLVHGSMDRDLDLLAVAWKDKAIGHYKLLEQFRKHLGAPKHTDMKGKPYYSHSVLGGGRDAYMLYLNHGYNSLGEHTEDSWYLDISFTPQLKESIQDMK